MINASSQTSAWRVAWALVRVPKLFLSLLFFPILLSLLLVFGQLILSSALITAFSVTNAAPDARVQEGRKLNIGRKILYGTMKDLPTLKVCRWNLAHLPSGELTEIPPSGAACSPDRLDIAIQVPDPQQFDTTPYEKLLTGNVERMHICRQCHPDVVIQITEHGIKTQVTSIFGLMVWHLVEFDSVLDQREESLKASGPLATDLFGSVQYQASGFLHALEIDALPGSLAIVFNVAMLIVISLWLALKAHRKVIDYFARSGALLPMVAAVGHQSFYGAIWLLTLARVFTFLLASIPMAYSVLQAFIHNDLSFSFFSNNPLAIGVWILSIVASFGFSTLIASVADLKERHGLLVFLYRYLPIIACLFGGAIWGTSFIVDGATAAITRNIMVSTPIIGMTAMILAPIFEPPLWCLLLNTALSIVGIIVLARLNARWFAAHLEEL